MSNKVIFPGYELREEREARGLSLTETYKRVHIPIRYIEALEQSNFDELPEPCFVKGFLKSYCTFLDLNAERFVNLYHEAVEPASTKILRGIPKQPISGPDWRTELLTWAAICAILAVGWFAYQIVVRPDAGAESNRVEAGTPGVNDEAQPPHGNPFEPHTGRDSGF